MSLGLSPNIFFGTHPVVLASWLCTRFTVKCALLGSFPSYPISTNFGIADQTKTTNHPQRVTHDTKQTPQNKLSPRIIKSKLIIMFTWGNLILSSNWLGSFHKPPQTRPTFLEWIQRVSSSSWKEWQCLDRSAERALCLFWSSLFCLEWFLSW